MYDVTIQVNILYTVLVAISSDADVFPQCIIMRISASTDVH